MHAFINCTRYYAKYFKYRMCARNTSFQYLQIIDRHENLLRNYLQLRSLFLRTIELQQMLFRWF